MPDPDDDDKTERELRRVRAESKERRLQLDELRDQLEGARTQATRLEKELATATSALAATKADLETTRTELTGKLTAAEQKLAADVAAAKAAADAEVANVKKGYETQFLTQEVKAAALQAGVLDADDFVKLVDLSKVTRDNDGKLTGVDELIKTAKEAKPYFFGDPKSTVKPGQQQPKPANPGEPKKATEMTDDEYKAGLKSLGVDLPAY